MSNELDSLREEIEVMDRQRRKLQSEIVSHRVDAERRDRLGSAHEIFLAGWRDGWDAHRDGGIPQTAQVSDWEIYQLDRARTQEPKGE